MVKSRFDICLNLVLRHEGGFSDHPADPGGATNMGITRKTLAAWRGISPWWTLSKTEVQSLTRAEAARIYRDRFWERCRAGQMPAGLDLAVFDYAVHSGPDRAIRALQKQLGVTVDGQAGPVTLAAIAQKPVPDLVVALCSERQRFLSQLPAFATFGKGWTSRVNAVRNAALAAAATNSPNIKQGTSIMDLLNGYKTYFVAVVMLLAGLAQLLGIDLPALDGNAAGHLIMEALAVLFLRKGLKTGGAGV
ncbi:MAG TPA: glycoside hydrolase family 108 protein [Devosia sp.]|jgi:lysozyme family protein|uniref:glycoside hydrolase family 108 protein n=1 Tax=Devosia sp. TaxID=1871048 RepID=UPI002F923CE0